MNSVDTANSTMNSDQWYITETLLFRKGKFLFPVMNICIKNKNLIPLEVTLI